MLLQILATPDWNNTDPKNKKIHLLHWLNLAKPMQKWITFVIHFSPLAICSTLELHGTSHCLFSPVKDMKLLLPSAAAECQIISYAYQDHQTVSTLENSSHCQYISVCSTWYNDSCLRCAGMHNLTIPNIETDMTRIAHNITWLCIFKSANIISLTSGF